jgi:hypothetical protein
MWTDPKYTLQDARERQSKIARDVDAFRELPGASPALGDVALTWVIALRITADYLRTMRIV